MDTIRVQTQGEEKFQEVLDALRPLGVTVVTGINDPIESVLFYIARMNSKFDNLGQLKHLHKPLKALEGVAFYATTYLKNKVEEQNVQASLRQSLFTTLKKETGFEPMIGSRNISFMTEEQIRALFKK